MVENRSDGIATYMADRTLDDAQARAICTALGWPPWLTPQRLVSPRLSQPGSAFPAQQYPQHLGRGEAARLGTGVQHLEDPQLDQLVDEAVGARI